MAEIDDLNKRFGVPGAVVFEAGNGNLVRAALTASQGSAHVYLHGAHVTHFQANGQGPLLFLSSESLFQFDKPIRGGIPICFPWFGPKSGDTSAPVHGFARLLQWNPLETKRLGDGSVKLVLGLQSSEATRSKWVHDFSAQLNVTVGAKLELTLRVTNTSSQAFTFEEALHTYFSVGDIKTARIDGLSGVRYLDKVDGAKEKTQSGAITIEGETDRVYMDATSATTIHDPSFTRKITVEKSGSSTTVVWNPWINKAKAMADFGDEEWPHMVCVETANAAKNAVQLAPGATHEMRAVMS